MNQPPNITPAFARQALSLPAAAADPPAWIQYMPPGTTEITAHVEGKPTTIKAVADAAGAAALNRDLDARREANEPAPYFAFDHIDGRASAWPQEFVWHPETGIKARVKWSRSGHEAVTGGDYRYFSPAWNIDRNTGRIIGLLPNGEAGSLVNDPAFRNIAAVAARCASHLSAQPAEPNQNKTEMKHEAIVAAVIKAGILTTEEAAGETAASLVETRIAAAVAAKASAATDTTELTSVKARLAAIETENTALKTAAADDAVAAAVKAGRIPPKDTATQAWWKEQIIASPAAVKALNAIPSAVPADSGATPPGAKPVQATAESAEVKARSAAVAAKAAEIQRTGKNIPWPQAYAEADRAIPPVTA